MVRGDTEKDSEHRFLLNGGIKVTVNVVIQQHRQKVARRDLALRLDITPRGLTAVSGSRTPRLSEWYVLRAPHLPVTGCGAHKAVGLLRHLLVEIDRNAVTLTRKHADGAVIPGGVNVVHEGFFVVTCRYILIQPRSRLRD